MHALFTFLAYASLICMLVALWKPHIYPLKNPTKMKALLFYCTAFILCFLLSEVSVFDQNENVVERSLRDSPATPSGKIAWLKVSQRTIPMPETGRDRLLITIVPAEPQETVTQKNLLLTATSLAVDLQRESDAPVVAVRFISQETGNALAEPLLANVVFIPDGKGYDGIAAGAPEWETLQAAQRGFTENELEYLRLWGELYLLYQSQAGTRTKELDRAISEKMGIKPGSCHPFANSLEPVAVGDLQ